VLGYRRGTFADIGQWFIAPGYDLRRIPPQGIWSRRGMFNGS
jgi:hypothetical protein